MRMRRLIHRHQPWLAVLAGFLLGFFFTSKIRTYLVTNRVIVSPALTCSSRSLRLPAAVDGFFDDLGPSSPPPPGKDLIFVGVMTAQKYLDTRALAVHETWATTLPGKVVFFSSAASRSRHDLPLVRLPGVDDSYPPQKKSFLMLKYIHDHYLDKFEWFMRADDDVYIRGDKLEKFLRSINSSRPHFIGQAGMGNKEEFGQLALEDGENFCMGGPGMIFSRETLRRVVPHIPYCLTHLYSTHEDVEVGRCVRKFAGIPCTWSYEMQTIFYHNSSGYEAFTGNLKNKEVHRAVTLHPVKHHQHLYRLHNYMQALRIQELEHKVLLLMRDIRDISSLIPDVPKITPNLDEFLNVLGKGPSLNKFKPRDFSEVILWDFFTKVIFSTDNSNPKRRIETPLKTALDDVVTQTMEMINKYSQQRGRIIEFKEILYGYRRVVPNYGVDYILDMLLVYKKYRGRKMTIPVRRHAYLQQAFTRPQVRELYSGSEESDDSQSTLDSTEMRHCAPKIRYNEFIHFVVPLADRYSTFERFVKNFEAVCLENDENVKLIVVLFRTSNESDIYRSVSLVEKLQKKYARHELRTVVVQSQFNRALALQVGAERFSSDSLLFFVDVDIYFTRSVLERLRFNTVKGTQAYYPIVFSQYDPAVVYGNVPVASDYVVIDEHSGYWRQYGFGIASIFKCDLMSVGGYDTSIQGWGREDVDFYERLLRSNMTIFRAPDPGLVHIFHRIVCDKNLTADQYAMCMGTRANSYGGQQKLADIVYRRFMKADGSVNL